MIQNSPVIRYVIYWVLVALAVAIVVVKAFGLATVADALEQVLVYLAGLAGFAAQSNVQLPARRPPEDSKP